MNDTIQRDLMNSMQYTSTKDMMEYCILEMFPSNIYLHGYLLFPILFFYYLFPAVDSACCALPKIQIITIITTKGPLEKARLLQYKNICLNELRAHLCQWKQSNGKLHSQLKTLLRAPTKANYFSVIHFSVSGQQAFNYLLSAPVDTAAIKDIYTEKCG